jgi:hypothetical protein
MWWCIRNSSAANFVGCTSSSTRFTLFSCSTSIEIKIGRVGTAIFVGVVVFVFFSSNFPFSILPLRDGRFYDRLDVVAGVAVFHCNGDGQCHGLPQSCGTLPKVCCTVIELLILSSLSLVHCTISFWIWVHISGLDSLVL